MDAFTAQQTTELISRLGSKKAHMRLDKLFFNSVIAGPLLGFGYISFFNLLAYSSAERLTCIKMCRSRQRQRFTLVPRQCTWFD